MSSVFSRSGIGQPEEATTKVRTDQIENSTGGFVFQVSDKNRLMRFLVLGTDGGTYYADEKKLTKDNVNFLVDLIERDEQMVIDTVLLVSTTGRAFRNSAAIFTVAALASYGKIRDLTFLVKMVCRTATHLFEFAEYIEMLGGWSRSKRTAVANWYTSKDIDGLAYQVVKYRQRNGWTHRDLLRLSHPVGLDARMADFILGKDQRTAAQATDMPDNIRGFLSQQESASLPETLAFLRVYPNLPWETIQTEYLKESQVWTTLFYNRQLTGQALLRNITRLARIGAFDDMDFAIDVAVMLTNENMIESTRLHPFQYLLALSAYRNGTLRREHRLYAYAASSFDKNWTTNPVIIDALNEGFYKAFKYVQPSGKRTLIALDVSASMASNMAGNMSITAAEAAAAMAMTVARTEKYYNIVGFGDTIRDLGISPSMNLDEVMRRTRDRAFGSTNPSLMFEFALTTGMKVDTFVVITDNEVNTGKHPFEMLKKYRRTMGLDSKLIVVACTPTNFTIADPTDRGMLDVCGADSNLPALIADFSAGRI